jgi:hypothetical protein
MNVDIKYKGKKEKRTIVLGVDMPCKHIYEFDF